jgi:hypothetical protein
LNLTRELMALHGRMKARFREPPGAAGHLSLPILSPTGRRNIPGRTAMVRKTNLIEGLSVAKCTKRVGRSEKLGGANPQ